MRARGRIVYRKAARVVCLGVLATAGLSFGQQQYTISTVAGGAPPATPALASGISVGQPRRVTMDSAGNLYFSSQNSVFKVTTGGTLTLIAGNSRPGYSGDGGPAIQAQLTAPAGLAFDTTGDLFIADAGNNVVREVTPNGIIQTVAGNGTTGYSGDQGPATQAQLHNPSGVAADSSGNLYIADTANNVIREVTGGIIQTFAGDGYASYWGDANQDCGSTTTHCSGNPSQAEFHGPEDVTVGPNGGIYIVDTVNSYIREVAGGAINFVSGSGTVGYSGDGGLANSPTTANGGGVALYDPQAIAFDSAGNYYLADTGNNRIRKINTKGIISTVAGNGNPGFSGDGGPATSAQLNQPTGVFVDGQGNLFIADNLNNRVRKVSTSGTISTVAGNGMFSYSGDGGPAIAAQLNAPRGAGINAKGNALFISDTQNAVVRFVNSAGISSIGGGSFVMPRGTAVDAAGNAYVADSLANVVWKIGTDGSVTKFAGNGTNGFGGDSGPATNAELSAPTAVALDTAGDVFIADFGNQRVREVTTAGIIATVAGSGSQGYGGDGGLATNASLNQAQGIAVDASGNLYIADTGNDVIREVTTNGVINTVAGSGSFGYSGDGGPAINAQLTGPQAVAVDPTGIYLIDGSTWIRKIYPNGTIGTIAGNGTLGYSGDAGLATKAQLNSPTTLSVDSSGNVYVADTGNSAIRRLQPVSANITISAVTNAASNQQGAIAPGEIVVLYGSGLGPSQAQSYQLGANGQVPTNLAGTVVVFNGVPGPVLYASPAQVAAIAPFELNGQTVQVAVQSQNHTSAPVPATLAAAAPGIFTANESGQGQAVAFNQDLSQNAAANPAGQGSLLSLYLTGAGQTSANSTDGSFAAPPLPLIPLPVNVTIGGQSAQVKYAGAAPGQVAGMVEIAVEVPTGIQAGSAVPVTVQIGGVSAQSIVTVAISQ